VAATKMVPSFFLGGGSTTCRNYNASKQEIYSEMAKIGLSKLRAFGQKLNSQKRGGG